MGYLEEIEKFNSKTVKELVKDVKSTASSYYEVRETGYTIPLYKPSISDGIPYWSDGSKRLDILNIPGYKFLFEKALQSALFKGSSSESKYVTPILRNIYILDNLSDSERYYWGVSYEEALEFLLS